MKKRNKHRELESNRIKSVRKRIIKKCLEMKEKLMLQRGLQQDEIENHVLVFRQMLFEKEEIPAHENLVDSPQKKVDTAKKSKSTKNKNVKGEKLRVIDSTSNQKSSEPSSISKRKRTDSEISSKHSSPTVLGANGASSGPSHRKSEQLQKLSKEVKASSVRSHSSSVAVDGATKDSSARKRTVTGASHEAPEQQQQQQRRHSRSVSTERRKSRSYSMSVSPHERLRNRSNDRHSSYHRSHSGARSPSRSLSRSRSPSIRRRRGSPSHLDRRRITRW